MYFVYFWEVFISFLSLHINSAIFSFKLYKISILLLLVIYFVQFFLKIMCVVLFINLFICLISLFQVFFYEVQKMAIHTKWRYYQCRVLHTVTERLTKVTNMWLRKKEVKLLLIILFYLHFNHFIVKTNHLVSVWCFSIFYICPGNSMMYYFSFEDSRHLCVWYLNVFITSYLVMWLS